MLELTFSLEKLDSHAASQVIKAIRSVRGVEDIRMGGTAAEPGRALHKGGLLEAVVTVAPEALQRVGAALAALFGLPGAPLPIIEVGTPNGPVRVPYDSRHQNLSDVVTQVERLLGRGGPTQV